MKLVRKLLITILSVMMLLTELSIHNVTTISAETTQPITNEQPVMASSVPTAWVEGYGDGSTSNFRVAQMLRVCTSGFSTSAVLRYHYYSTNDSRAFDVFEDNLVRGVRLLKKKSEKGIMGLINKLTNKLNKHCKQDYESSSPYFAVLGKDAIKMDIKIIIWDCNQYSETYNQSVELHVKDFAKANLSADICCPHGLFVGESMSMLQLLTNSGVAHIWPERSTCARVGSMTLSNIDAGTITWTGINEKTVLTAEKAGLAQLTLSMSKSKDCDYHSGQSGAGSSYIFVFKMPTITPAYDGFDLTDTQAGVTYKIHDISLTATYDGELLSFRGLADSTTYEIVVSAKLPNNSIVRRSTYATTLVKYVVDFDYVTISGLDERNIVPVRVKRSNVETISRPDGPYAYGAVLTDWYVDSARTILYDFNSYVTGDMTLYGKWTMLKSSVRVTISLNGTPYSYGTVSLCQFGVYKYTLNELVAGVYGLDNAVINGTYEIYVNGSYCGADVTVNSKKYEYNLTQYERENLITGETYSVDVPLAEMKTVVFVDDIPGENGTIYYKKVGKEPIYTVYQDDSKYYQGVIFKNNTDSFDIYYNEKDIDINKTGRPEKNISVSDSYKVIKFYTITLHLKSDVEFNGDVTLRDGYGSYLDDMKEGTYNPITHTKDYTYVMAMDEGTTPTAYTIYVDGVDTKNVVYALKGKCEASAEIYTVTFNVSKSSNPWNDAEIKLFNGIDTYVLRNGNNGQYVAHLLKTKNEGKEVTYSYTVVGTIDKDIEERVVSSNNTNFNLDYNVVDFKSYETNDSGRTYTLSSKSYRTQIVLNGIPAKKIASPYLASMTFNCWSEDEWSLSESSVIPFDLTANITEDHTLYAHFKKPGVEINGFVKTNEAGEIDGEGTYYRMLNLVISGFDDGQVIKSLLVQTTETQEIIIPKHSGALVQVETETAEHLTASKKTTGNTITITFENKVTMTEAQNYLRELIVKPRLSVENGMKVIVSDGVIEANGSGTITQNQCSDTTWTKLSSLTTGSSAGYTLYSGKYYVDKNITFTNSNVGGSGLTIIGTVDLYIPSGITLTATGRNAEGTIGGGAGILLTSGNILNLYGNGTVNATGGNGANGAASATSIGNGYCHTDDSKDKIKTSSGGSGGNGGGGAGAGIGSAGGTGGTGGAGGAAVEKTYNPFKRSEYHSENGNNGTSGTNGLSADGFGTLNKANNIKINAKGGSGGLAGGAVNTDSAHIEGTSYDSLTSYRIGFGGLGGGGGSGWPAYDIGTGGTGGGGGGGGGSSGVTSSCKQYTSSSSSLAKKTSNGTPSGQSGTGGCGYVNGQTYQPPTAPYNDVTVTLYKKDTISGSTWSEIGSQTYHGGTGGAAGASTNASISKSAGSCTLSTSQINFIGATSGGTFSYNFDTSSKTYVVPDYEASDGVVFVGWKIKTYAKNVAGASASKKWTTAESAVYVPGEVVTIDATTYGTIEFVPITIGIAGKYVEDEMKIPANVFVPAAQPIEYHEYIINTTLNDEDKDIGIITLVDTQDANHIINIGGMGTGKYTYVSEEDTIFKIYLNGVYSDVTVGWFRAANVAAKSVTVTVMKDDEANSDECLVSLSNEEGDYEARPYYVEGTNSGEYTLILLTTKYTNPLFNITVDEMKTGKSVNFNGDNTETIELYTIEVTVNTLSTIESVEIETIGKEPITLEQFEDTSTYKYVGLKDETTEYEVVVNGYDSGAIVKYNSTNRKATLNMHILTVETYLDNTKQEIQNYKPVYRGSNMKPDGTGTYTIAEFGEVEKFVIVDLEQEFVDEHASSYYYSVTYHLDSGEEGETPVDLDYYLSGTDVTIASAKNINKDGFLFAGWKDTTTNEIYFALEKLTVTDYKIDLVATWKNLNEFPVIVYYQGEEYHIFPEQIPEILQERNYPESGNDEPAIQIIITGGDPLIQPLELPELYLGPKDTLTIVGPAEVTIPEDTTIINEGKIIIEEGNDPDNPGKLIVKGELINKGDIDTEGEIDVEGKLTNEDGTIENEGDIIVEKEGKLENKGEDGRIINKDTIIIDGGELINDEGTIENEENIYIDDGGHIQNEGIIENDGGLLEGKPDGDGHHTGDPVAIDNNGFIDQKPDGEIGTRIENEDGVIKGGTLIEPGEIIGGIVDGIKNETPNEPTDTMDISGSSKEPSEGGKLPKEPTQEKIDEIFGPGNAELLTDEFGNPILDEDGSYTIILIRGVNLENPIEVPEDVDVKIELNGRNIDGPIGEPAIEVTGGELEIHDDAGRGKIRGGEGDPENGGDGGEGIIITKNSHVKIDEDVTIQGGPGTDGGDGGTGILIDMPEDGDGYIEIEGIINGGDGSSTVDEGDKPGNGGKGIDIISAPRNGVVVKETEDGAITGGDGGDHVEGPGGDGGAGLMIKKTANPDLIDMKGKVSGGDGGITPPKPEEDISAWDELEPSGESGMVASGKRVLRVIINPNLDPSVTLHEEIIVDVEDGLTTAEYTMHVNIDRSDLYLLPKDIVLNSGDKTIASKYFTYTTTSSKNDALPQIGTIVLKQATKIQSLDGQIIIDVVGVPRVFDVTWDGGVGYEIEITNSKVELHNSTEIQFTLKPGYSKLDNFTVFVNGEAVELDENDHFIIEDICKDTKITVQGVADITAPEGVIKVARPQVEYGVKKNIYISATDLGSGMKDIFYYVSEKQLTPEEVIDITTWTIFEDVFNIDPYTHFYIYAKLVDKVGNVAYISEDSDNMSEWKKDIQVSKDSILDKIEFTIEDAFLALEGHPEVKKEWIDLCLENGMLAFIVVNKSEEYQGDVLNKYDIIYDLLNDDDVVRIASGDPITIILTIEQIDKKLVRDSEAFKALRKNSSGVKAALLEFNLFKQFSGGLKEYITETKDPLEIEMQVAEKIQGEKYSYTMFLSHEETNGSISINSFADEKENDNAMTFSTNKLCLGYLTYKKEGAVATGITIAGFALILLFLLLFVRKVKFVYGTTTKTKYVLAGSKLKQPEIDEVSGWFKDEKYEECWNFDEDKVKKNLTLYGKMK